MGLDVIAALVGGIDFGRSLQNFVFRLRRNRDNLGEGVGDRETGQVDPFPDSFQMDEPGTGDQIVGTDHVEVTVFAGGVQVMDGTVRGQDAQDEGCKLGR